MFVPVGSQTGATDGAGGALFGAILTAEIRLNLLNPHSDP